MGLIGYIGSNRLANVLMPMFTTMWRSYQALLGLGLELPGTSSAQTCAKVDPKSTESAVHRAHWTRPATLDHWTPQRYHLVYIMAPSLHLGYCKLVYHKVYWFPHMSAGESVNKAFSQFQFLIILVKHIKLMNIIPCVCIQFLRYRGSALIEQVADLMSSDYG